MGSELGIVVPICGVDNHGWDDLQLEVSNDLLFCVFEDFNAPSVQIFEIVLATFEIVLRLREGCRDAN